MAKSFSKPHDTTRPYVWHIMEAQVKAYERLEKSRAVDPACKSFDDVCAHVLRSDACFEIVGSGPMGLHMLSADADFRYHGTTLRFIQSMDLALKPGFFRMEFPMANLVRVTLLNPGYQCANKSFDVLLANVNLENVADEIHSCQAELDRLVALRMSGTAPPAETRLFLAGLLTAYVDRMADGTGARTLAFDRSKSEFFRKRYEELASYKYGKAVLLMLRSFASNRDDGVPTYALVLMALMVLRADGVQAEPDEGLQCQFIMEALLAILDLCLPTTTPGLMPDPYQSVYATVRETVFLKFVRDFKLDEYRIRSPDDLWVHFMSRPQLMKFKSKAGHMRQFVFSLVSNRERMEARGLGLASGQWLLRPASQLPMLPLGVSLYLSWLCVLFMHPYSVVEWWYHTSFPEPPHMYGTGRKRAAHALAMPVVYMAYNTHRVDASVLTFFQAATVLQQTTRGVFGDFHEERLPVNYHFHKRMAVCINGLDTLGVDMRKISVDLSAIGANGAEPMLVTSFPPPVVAALRQNRALTQNNCIKCPRPQTKKGCDDDDSEEEDSEEHKKSKDLLASILAGCCMHVLFVRMDGLSNLWNFNMLNVSPVKFKVRISEKADGSGFNSKKERDVWSLCMKTTEWAELSRLGHPFNRMSRNTGYGFVKPFHNENFLRVNVYSVSFMDRQNRHDTDEMWQTDTGLPFGLTMAQVEEIIETTPSKYAKAKGKPSSPSKKKSS